MGTDNDTSPKDLTLLEPDPFGAAVCDGQEVASENSGTVDIRRAFSSQQRARVDTDSRMAVSLTALLLLTALGGGI